MDKKRRHYQIRQRLLDTGYTIQSLADEIGVSRPTVSMVSSGLRTAHRVQEHIAQKLGTTPEELFPERYNKEKAQ